MTLRTTPPKDPEERVPVPFDFSADMAADDTLGTAELTVEAVVAGADASPGAILDGAPLLSGQTLVQWVRLGVEGATYRLKCKVTTAQGRTLVLRGLLPVAAELA